MQQILIVIHLIITLLLIGTVLMQRSEGGALGIGGGSGNVFSSRGAGSFLTRLTAILATAFFATSIALAILATKSTTGSIFDSVPATQEAPADGSKAPATPPVESLLPKLEGQPAEPAPAQQ